MMMEGMTIEDSSMIQDLDLQEDDRHSKELIESAPHLLVVNDRGVGVDPMIQENGTEHELDGPYLPSTQKMLSANTPPENSPLLPLL